MDIVNRQALKRNVLRGNFILLLSGLFILTISWKKEGKVNVETFAKTVKKDSTILLAALKTARVNTIRVVNTAPTEIAGPEGQLHAKAQLQAYMDSLIISPAATIGLKRDAKAVNENNTIEGQQRKPLPTSKAINNSNFVIDNTTKLRKVLPPDLPSDPDF